MIMVSVYINNFLLASKYRKPFDQIKSKLKKKYNVKDLEEIKMIIGWQVTQGPSTIKIDQLVFIRDLVEDAGMQDCNPVSTPMKAVNFIEMQGKVTTKMLTLKSING